MILAASGPFFHAILKKNKHPHPLVFMRGVKLEGLVNLVCSESGTQTFVESETIESEIEERCTGEKPFVCTQCSYSSTTADNLKTHLRIHSGEKPFNCTECEFYCDNKKDFGTHKLLIHANKNPFRCRICGETLQSKADLMMHRKKEHIETVAVCKNIKNGDCPFSNQGCWWNHQRQSRGFKGF